MRRDIFAVSKLLKGKTQLSCKDYKDILKHISKDDVVYLDPPYQGVCQNRDSRYYNGIDFNELVLELKDLVYDNISFILSYDGRRGNKSYGRELPKSLGLRRIEINAGRSTQATLLGMNDITYESVYLSPALISRLQLNSNHLTDKLFNPITLSNYQ